MPSSLGIGEGLVPTSIEEVHMMSTCWSDVEAQSKGRGKRCGLRSAFARDRSRERERERGMGDGVAAGASSLMGNRRGRFLRKR